MSKAAGKAAIRVILMIIGYFLIQAVVLVAHEHVHSTMAWLLGYTPTPFTVVWGNPITIRGWDEGVPYDALFPRDGNPAEAAIGGMPLLMHAVLVSISAWLLCRAGPVRRSWLFFLLYALLICNLAELIYILMRPFIPTGDTGRFNHGLQISPWFLFIGGTVFLAIILWTLAWRIMPRARLQTNGSRAAIWAVVSSTAFILFMWGSGLRMLSLYPDPQWKTGLVGVAGFLAWLAIAAGVRSRPVEVA